MGNKKDASVLVGGEGGKLINRIWNCIETNECRVREQMPRLTMFVEFD